MFDMAPSDTVINIGIMASGSGTNAENLIRFFQFHPFCKVVLVVTNNAKAGVIERSLRLGVATEVLTNDAIAGGSLLINILHRYKVKFIVLAGFLRKIPSALIREWPDAILNIHPSLLPMFGGKGMYGEHVHRAVVSSGVAESGITIHLVNAEYDQGTILCQSKVAIDTDETVDSLSKKIHLLEHQYLPQVVESYVKRLFKIH